MGKGKRIGLINYVVNLTKPLTLALSPFPKPKLELDWLRRTHVNLGALSEFPYVADEDLLEAS